MLTLSYSACYDPYNTVFRLLCILRSAPEQRMFDETIRIADFFLCFPMRLNELRPPNSVSGMRRRKNAAIREASFSEYELLPSSRVLFERMEITQETAMSALSAKSIVFVDKETGGGMRTISLMENSISSKLIEETDRFISSQRILIDLVSKDFPLIKVNGPDGIKARTGLGEWQYDTI